MNPAVNTSPRPLKAGQRPCAIALAARFARMGLLTLATVPFSPRCSQAASPDRSTVSRLPIAVDSIAPLIFVKTQTGHLFIDFGKDSFAGLELKVPHPQPGRKLTVWLGEALAGPHAINQKPGGSVRFLSSDVVLQAGTDTYRVPLTAADARRTSDQTGAVMPFRYVEIEGAPSDLDQDHIRQLVAHYPFDDGAARFSCSDPRLNAIWELCHHTMEATSFAGVFIDGDRERTPYEADAYINQLGWYCCTPDVTLPRYSWEYLIDHPTWPTEWIMFSVLLAWNDYQYTGDTAGLERFYSDLQAKTLIALDRPDGLISTTQKIPLKVGKAIHLQKKLRDIVDWPVSERDGYEMKPVNTVVNAFHAVALQRMSEIARVLNHTEDSARFQAAAARTVAALNQTLFNEQTGLYVDGEGSRHSSMHANFFPLAFGLVPPARQKKIVDYLAGRNMACSVYGAQFFLEALFDHGQADAAIALMTAAGDRSWTHMVGSGATMTWEAWDSRFKPNQDWNHAWGAAPANLIPCKLMGIQPLEPGFARISIAPPIDSLKWAQVRVPTAKGSVFVRFENEPHYRLAVELPPGTTGRIGIPVAAPDGPAMVLLDGKPTPAAVRSNTAYVDGVDAGRHVLTRQ
jgi:alpha-L-rhamnosidase